MSESQKSRLDDLLDRLKNVSQRDNVSIGDVLAAVGRRSMIPFLLVPAFIAATPLSGIPGLTTVCGLIIALVAARLLLDFDRMFLPGWLERRSVEGERLRSVLNWAVPVVRWIDYHSRSRWSGLFRKPLLWIPESLCLLTGVTMPFLELIPFTGSIAATGVCLLALSMLMRDGLLFVLALIPYAGLIYVLFTQLL